MHQSKPSQTRTREAERRRIFLDPFYNRGGHARKGEGLVRKERESCTSYAECMKVEIIHSCALIYDTQPQ